MIEVENLTKRYGPHIAVSGISFVADKGEILGFLGPNGAGKTTTMRMLTCYLPPSDGRARVAGFDILDEPLEVRRRIGYLPENVPLYTDLTVNDFLLFVARLKGMPRKNRTARLLEVMDECGIAHVRSRQIGKLSKGYRQRVGLAQALLNDPEVLILDEPTVGLDPQQIIEIRELIQGLAGKRTVILSTHILPEVSLLCQRVIIINQGKLITIDTPDNLKSGLRRGMVIDVKARGEPDSIIGQLDKMQNVQKVRLTRSSQDNTHDFRVETGDHADIREDIARTVVHGGFGLVGLTTVDLSLEDIFVHLVTQEETD